MAKIYDVTVPRPYRDAAGNEKTHFWQVGTAFPLKETDGFSIKLFSKMIVTDRFVVFARDEQEQAQSKPPQPDDDIPF